MTKYEITGYIQIPVFYTLEADSPAQALEEGSEAIEMGLGVQGEQYWQEEFTAWDLDADKPAGRKD